MRMLLDGEGFLKGNTKISLNRTNWLVSTFSWMINCCSPHHVGSSAIILKHHSKLRIIRIVRCNIVSKCAITPRYVCNGDFFPFQKSLNSTIQTLETNTQILFTYNSSICCMPIAYVQIAFFYLTINEFIMLNSLTPVVNDHVYVGPLFRRTEDYLISETFNMNCSDTSRCPLLWKGGHT